MHEAGTISLGLLVVCIMFGIALVLVAMTIGKIRRF